MVQSGEIQGALGETLWLAFAGFVVGSASGLACGLLMGAIPFLRRSLDPVIAAAWASPKLTLLPILMLVFGVGDAPRIALVALGCFIVMAMSTLDAMQTISPRYLELARNYGAGRRAILNRVYVPATLPLVFSGLRLSLGRALTITVAVEMVGAESGLGAMIWLAWQAFAIEKVYIGAILAASMGMLFHLSLRALERRLIPWAKEGQGV
jgi:ABC-type nitrate/sulfonate/bicarbonate transport system permease component